MRFLKGAQETICSDLLLLLKCAFLISNTQNPYCVEFWSILAFCLKVLLHSFLYEEHKALKNVNSSEYLQTMSC